MRVSYAEVRGSAIVHNVQELRRLSRGVPLLGVVKAEAYGHGAVEVARLLEAQGVRWLGVAFLEEALRLRQAGVKAAILVMGGLREPAEVPEVAEHGLRVAISDLGALRTLGRWARHRERRIPVHLKVDTGMGRLGVTRKDLPRCLEALREEPLELEGIMSHLAAADVDPEYTWEQIGRFQEALGMAQRFGLRPRVNHLANSAALLHGGYPLFDLVRVGIALYGVHPHPSLRGRARLRPAMSLRSPLLLVKELPAGSWVGYGRTHRCSRTSRIGVLPLGYAHGYPRSLSNRGEAWVCGRRAPVVGTVCMDLTCLDLTDVPGAEVGHEVELWGEHVSVEEVAGWAGTIPYELLTGLRVPRRYVGVEAIGA